MEKEVRKRKEEGGIEEREEFHESRRTKRIRNLIGIMGKIMRIMFLMMMKIVKTMIIMEVMMTLLKRGSSLQRDLNKVQARRVYSVKSHANKLKHQSQKRREAKRSDERENRKRT